MDKRRNATNIRTKPFLIARPLSHKAAEKLKNVNMKSKILIVTGLIFLTVNLLISSLFIFSIENYNAFISSTKQLDLYLDLHKNFFKSNEFINHFKVFDTNFNYYNDYLKRIINYRSRTTENKYNGLFNSNYTSSAYLQHLTKIYNEQENPNEYLQAHPIDFHWADWMDLSAAQPLVKAYDSILKSSSFRNDESKLRATIYKMCYTEVFGQRKPWMDNQDVEAQVNAFEQLQDIGICSAIFLHYYWTIPERILFESDFKYFKIPVKENRLKNPLGINGLAKVYGANVNEFIENPNDLPNQLDGLLQAYETKNGPLEKIKLKVEQTQDPQDFEKPDFEGLYKKYETMKNRSPEDEKYFKFLQYSKLNPDVRQFYFTFPTLKIDNQAELHHYTFPWVRQVISHEQRITVIHHLIRSWFKFAEQADLISWFNYGNSIGWYFNAMNLPWDNDIDVQVSINDLDKIGRFHNNTLIIEDPNIGDNLFWLHTDPFYLKENIEQFIDARYIDIKTGIYIDISALWHDSVSPPLKVRVKEGEIGIRCKHKNWFAFSDIFPIKRTIYEGAQSYKVRDIPSALIKEYGRRPMKVFHFANHNWQPDIGLWVQDNICYLNTIPKNRFDEDGNLTLEGACNNIELLEQYNRAKPANDLHRKEVELIEKGESTEELTKESLPVFRFFNHEDYR